MLGQVEGKRRRGQSVTRWKDSVMVEMNAPLGDLKEQGRREHNGEKTM